MTRNLGRVIAYAGNQPCRHQACRLDKDIALCEWVGDALVCTDRRLPDGSVAGIVGPFLDCETRDSVVDSGGRNSLGIEAHKHLGEARSRFAHQCVGTQLDVVEEHRELFLRRPDRRVDSMHRQTVSVGWNDEQR